uniref:Uncharacterized protein n=1 Tax=Steinernema glaseri TaxID=37863 RepID=A0A1I8AU57_9BILA
MKSKAIFAIADWPWVRSKLIGFTDLIHLETTIPRSTSPAQHPFLSVIHNNTNASTTFLSDFFPLPTCLRRSDLVSSV